MLQNKDIRNLGDLRDQEFPLDTSAMWSGIEAGLSANRRKKLIFWWVSGVAASLLCMVMVMIGIHHHHQNESGQELIQNSSNPSQPLPSKQANPIQSDRPDDQADPSPDRIPAIKSFKNPTTPVIIGKNKPEIPENFNRDPWILLPKMVSFDFKHTSFVPELASLIPGFKTIVDPKKEPVKLGWEVFAATTPNFTDKIVGKDQQLGWRVNKDFEKIAELSEKSAAGFQVQLGMQLNIGAHWFVQSGFNYSEKREWVKYNHVLKEFPIVRASEQKLEYAPLNPSQWVQVSHQGNNEYSFLEIPVQVGYRSNLGPKFEWRTRMGVSYWRLLETNGSKINPTDLLLEDLGTTKNYRNNSLGTAVYSGLYYKLNNQWQVMAEPSASVSLTNLTVNTPVKTRPYQYGLNIGVQYRIK